MCLMASFIPASVFTTLSYFVWFAAGSSEGYQQWLGHLLALWLLVLAAGFITCGAYVTFTHKCPLDKMFKADGA